MLQRRLLTAPRALLALILLGGAYSPLSYVVRAWRYFSAVATPEEWRQAYAGFALAGLAGLVPTVIALVLLLRRRSVEIDVAERHLTAVCDDRVFTRRRRFTFAEVLRISVTRRQSRGTPATFPVSIVMHDGSTLEVSRAPDKAQALQTAALLARSVRVDVAADTSA